MCQAHGIRPFETTARAGDAGAVGPVIGWGAGATPDFEASAIEAGTGYACAIEAETGAVVCWGAFSVQATAPAEVDGSAGVATSVAAGERHSCAIQAGTGAVHCWGDQVSGPGAPPTR